MACVPMEVPPQETSAPTDKHASDFLANERTFLAWIRTSVAVISLGFVIAKFRIWLEDLARARLRPTVYVKAG